MLMFNRKTISIYIILLSSIFQFAVFAETKLKDEFIGILNSYNNKEYKLKLNNVKNSKKSIDELGFILYDHGS